MNTNEELTKAQRRKIAREKKKLNKANHVNNSKAKRKEPKAKLTKEERRVKYTLKFKEKREQSTQSKRTKDLICFHCREIGHTAAECPTNDGGNNTNLADRICYKCGSTEHRLVQCPKLKNKRYNLSKERLPFATCFLCKAKGHLSGQCSQNEHGIYPKGGACNNCGSKFHLSSDCSEGKRKDICTPVEDGDGVELEGMVNDDMTGGGDALPVTSTVTSSKNTDEDLKRRKNKRVVTF